MRRQILRDAGLFALVIGLGAFIAMQATRHSALAASRSGNPAVPAIPKTPIIYPEIPAQRPTGSAAMSPTHPNQNPAFTTDELRQYLVSTPGAFGNNKASDIAITRLDCDMKVWDVNAILQRVNIGLPNDMALCYVEFNGTVTYYGLPSRQSPHGNTLTFTTGFRVFDAQTGNLMLAGGLDHPSK